MRTSGGATSRLLRLSMSWPQDLFSISLPLHAPTSASNAKGLCFFSNSSLITIKKTAPVALQEEIRCESVRGSLKGDLALVSPHDGSLPDCSKKEEELRCVG